MTQPHDRQSREGFLDLRHPAIPFVPGVFLPAHDVVLAGPGLARPQGRFRVAIPQPGAHDPSTEGASHEPPPNEWPGIVEPDDHIGARYEDLVGALACVLPLGHPALGGSEGTDVVEELGPGCPLRPVVERIDLMMIEPPALGDAPCQCRLARPGDPRDEYAHRRYRERVIDTEHPKILSAEYTRPTSGCWCSD